MAGLLNVVWKTSNLVSPTDFPHFRCFDFPRFTENLRKLTESTRSYHIVILRFNGHDSSSDHIDKQNDFKIQYLNPCKRINEKLYLVYNAIKKFLGWWFIANVLQQSYKQLTSVIWWEKNIFHVFDWSPFPEHLEFKKSKHYHTAYHIKRCV